MTEIFFGTEDESDARFVFLEDCGHMMESSGMDQWINSRYSQQDTNSIQLPECPKCKTPVRRNNRYSAYIKLQLDAIEKIKIRSHGNFKDISKAKKRLIEEIDKSKEFSNLRIAVEIKNHLQKEIPLSDCHVMQNKWNLLKKLNELEKLSLNEKKENRIETWQLNNFMFEMNKLLPILTDYIKFINSNQQIQDMSLELTRIEKLLKLFKLQTLVKQTVYEGTRQREIAEAFCEMDQCLVVKAIRYDEVKKRVEEIFEKLGSLLLIELTKEETIMIVKTIGLSQGHWFKCKNGHIYCIGECGGAMQEATCPECKETIGGRNHRLAAHNSIAPEMDNARFAAYSDAANNLRNNYL